jgi:hypothetical protein
MPAKDFMDLCAILGKFQELANHLKNGELNVRIG